MNVHWENRLIALAGEAPRPAVSASRRAVAADFALESAYRLGARITAQHSRSFYMASSFLPRIKRQAIRAMYAFCRTVDDIADDPAHARAQDHLEQWREFSLGRGTSPLAGVGEAWADTLNRFQIPRRYASQLIDGVARDLSQSGYENFDDLATYCYGVASTVGLMSMYVIGFESAAAVPYAIKLGVALQMTNILRDVGEDLRRGRLYLPRLELREFGVSEADLAAGRVTACWRSFMRFQMDRTRRLYREAAPGIQMLDRDGRVAIAAAADLYAGILREIERNDYDVFSRRASVGTIRKLLRVPPLFIGSIVRR